MMNYLPFDVKDAILHSNQVIFILILVYFDWKLTLWMVYKFLGTKKLEYKGHQWHEQCFLCDGCKVPIGSNPFVPKESENFCSKCYEDRFANKCTKCTGVSANIQICFHFNQWLLPNWFWRGSVFLFISISYFSSSASLSLPMVLYCNWLHHHTSSFPTFAHKKIQVISTGGVTYQNSHFHTECLLCNNCNVQLAGQRFSKTPDGRMLCTECVCTLFARKCAACPNPIAGMIFSITGRMISTLHFSDSGGSGIKFIAFEERNWHHDCFNCVECKTSLVGRGFMTEGQDIICSDCAKAKLAAA